MVLESRKKGVWLASAACYGGGFAVFSLVLYRCKQAHDGLLEEFAGTWFPGGWQAYAPPAVSWMMVGWKEVARRACYDEPISLVILVVRECSSTKKSDLRKQVAFFCATLLGLDIILYSSTICRRPVKRITIWKHLLLSVLHRSLEGNFGRVSRWFQLFCYSSCS